MLLQHKGEQSVRAAGMVRFSAAPSLAAGFGSGLGAGAQAREES